jgi:hypothetical protein
MKQELTPGFTVIDYQSTPSGYYQMAFRSANGGTIVSTQHGRGGCNLYTPYTLLEELKNWLWENRQLAIDGMVEMGFPSLAAAIQDKESEWYDIVVMGIADSIELRRLSVQG